MLIGATEWWLEALTSPAPFKVPKNLCALEKVRERNRAPQFSLLWTQLGPEEAITSGLALCYCCPAASKIFYMSSTSTTPH